MEKNETIRAILNLRDDYEKERATLTSKKDLLIQKKKELYNQVIENIKSEISTSTNNLRLQRYLESTYTRDLEFLYRSLRFMAGNNQHGSLSFHELLYRDEYIKSVAKEFDIKSSGDIWDIISRYNFHRISHPFLESEEVLKRMAKVSKLSYLDELFSNIDNVLDFQGGYTVYRYVKKYLSSVLKEEVKETDQELVYKDYNEKLDFVLSHLADISEYLLSIREKTPSSRLAICNHGLSRTAKKQLGTSISHDQKIFANGIAFGTTLEKLENRNYEDAEELIFIPHQKILK